MTLLASEHSLGSVKFQATEQLLRHVGERYKSSKFINREIISRVISLLVASIFAIYDTMYHALFFMYKSLACVIYKVTDKDELSNLYFRDLLEHLSLVCLSVLNVVAAPIIGFCNPGMANAIDRTGMPASDSENS